MNILITGGAGFIGSSLADALLRKGHSIQIIDNLSTGRIENIPSHPYSDFIKGVVQYEGILESLFLRKQPDIVIHAAASYSDPTAWVNDIVTNAIGTAQIVKQCVKHKVKRIIYFQTSLCYGPPIQKPIRLDHPINPRNSYAISKTAGEQLILMSGLRYQIFRLANIYGPRNLSGPIPTFYKNIQEGKKCTIVNTRRDFIYISDLVRLLVEAVDENSTSGTFHVSSGRDYDIASLFSLISNALPGIDAIPELRKRGEDDVETIMLDPTETSVVFGWQPKVSIEEGIGKAIQWYNNNPIDETYTHLRGNDED